jgi:hypothetical protein
MSSVSVEQAVSIGTSTMTDSNEVASAVRSAKARQRLRHWPLFLEPRTQLDECPELVVGELRQRKRGALWRARSITPRSLCSLPRNWFSNCLPAWRSSSRTASAASRHGGQGGSSVCEFPRSPSSRIVDNQRRISRAPGIKRGLQVRRLHHARHAII